MLRVLKLWLLFGLNYCASKEFINHFTSEIKDAVRTSKPVKSLIFNNFLFLCTWTQGLLLSLAVRHNSYMPFVHVTKSCAFLEGYLANAVIFWTSWFGWVLSVQWSDSCRSKVPTQSSPLAKNTLTAGCQSWRMCPGWSWGCCGFSSWRTGH